MSNCLYQWRHAKGRIDESTIYIIIKTTCSCSSLVKSEPTRLRPKELNLWAKLHCFCVSIDTTTTCNLHEGVTTQCCFTSTETVLGTGRPGWPLRLSHSSCALTDCVQIQCWFTSTETEQTTRDWGGQDVHLDFHTAPQLCRWGETGHVLYYVVILNVGFVVPLILLSEAVDLCTIVRLDNAYFIM